MISFIYDFIYSVPLTVFLTLLLGPSLGVPEGGLTAVVGGVVFTSIILAIKHAIRKYRIIILGSLIAFTIGFFLVIDSEKRALLFEVYRYLLWVLLFAIISVVLGFVITYWKWGRIATIGILLTWCLVMLFEQFIIPKAGFAIAMFIVSVCMIEELQRHWKKSGDIGVKTHVAMLSPVIVVFSIVVFVIPASSKPYDWALFKQIYNVAAMRVKQLSGLITHMTEEYGAIGFSEEGEFSGNLGLPEYDDVIRIETNKSGIKGLYLIGDMSGKYTGRGWDFKDEAEAAGRMLDTLETITATRKFGRRQSDFVDRLDLSYESLFFNTKYMFGPAKTRVEARNSSNPDFIEEANRLMTKKRLKYGDSYFLSSYMVNYRNPDLAEWLSTAEPISEDEWKSSLVLEDVYDLPKYSFDKYKEYQTSIYDNYAGRVGLSEKVEEILSQIVGDASAMQMQSFGNKGEAENIQSNQDKYYILKQLEGYLRTYEYTLTPGALPDTVNDGRTFLDYFMLESQRGYCMHYATAFVLLARELGYPSRYVQGFYAEKSNGLEFVVSEGNAHSWAEVYFDNVGWIAFDPTPRSFVQTGWKTQGETSYDIDLDAYYAALYAKEHANLSTGEVSLIEILEEKESFDLRIILVPVAWVVGFLILAFIISRLIAKWRYLHMSNEARFTIIVRDNLRLLKYFGYRLTKGETLAEYKTRVAAGLRAFYEEESKQGRRSAERYDYVRLDFISYYEENVYGGKSVSEEWILDAEANKQILRKQIGRGIMRNVLGHIYKK